MTSSITRGHDTYTASALPNTNYSDASTLTLGAGFFDVYVYLPLPDDIAGQTIVSATLACHLAAATLSSQTFTTKLITSTWAASTCTWNNHPTFPGSGGVTTTVPISAAGAEVDIDVSTLLQAVASGQAYYGFHISTSLVGATSLYSFESGVTSWTLTLSYSDAPEIPQSLVPNGTVVGSGAPVLTCDFVDNGGLSQDMAAMEVQISTSTSFGSPVYDQTGTTTVPVFDLSNPPSPATAFTAVSSGTTRYWRCQVQDSDGNWSGWSDPAAFTYWSKPTITVNTPAAGVLYDPTSHINATSSANMSAFRVQVTSGTDRTDVLYDSGKTPANPGALTTVDVTLPYSDTPGILAGLGIFGTPLLTDDTTYQLHIRVWDTFTSRQSTPGSPAYTDSWTTFTFADDSGVTAPTTLVVDQPDAGPGVVLTWTRAAAPDGWVIRRDGKTIHRTDGTNVIIGASTYSWTDQHPPQWVSHTYVVKAVTGLHQSQPSPSASITPDLRDVWLYTQDGQQVFISAPTLDQLTVSDRLSTYSPVNLDYDVDIVAGHGGLQGTVTGVVLSDEWQDALDAKATLLSIRSNPSTWVRMVYGTFSGRVLLRNVSVLPHPSATSTNQAQMVSFGVNQVGDFDSVK